MNWTIIAVALFLSLSPSQGAMKDWPPTIGQPFPALTLMDQTGHPFSLTSRRGSVILLEPVGMSCPACQSFSGAKKHGAFGGISPQADLPPLNELLASYAPGVSPTDPRLVHVQLLLYNVDMQPPTSAEVKAWADHFALDRSKNQIVLGEIGRAHV